MSSGYKEVKGKRSIFGKLVKFLFIAFNLLMIWWIFAGVGESAEHIEGLNSELQRNAAAAGTGLGVLMIMVIWALGDVVLGMLVLFTRPARMMVADNGRS